MENTPATKLTTPLGEQFDIVEQVLIEGLYDVLLPDWIYSACKAKFSATLLEVRPIAIGVIVELLVAGEVDASYADGGAWHEWAGGAGEIIVKFVKEWLEVGPLGPPPPWSLVMLKLTEKGRNRAMALIGETSPEQP